MLKEKTSKASNVPTPTHKYYTTYTYMDIYIDIYRERDVCEVYMYAGLYQIYVYIYRYVHV